MGFAKTSEKELLIWDFMRLVLIGSKDKLYIDSLLLMGRYKFTKSNK
jgi:hypothetical protein